MKTKKRKRVQTTHHRVRERRMATEAFLALVLLIVAFSAYYTYNSLNQQQNQTTNPASAQSKAAIVDQLSLTCPNQTFIQTTTNILQQAGYTVDYFPGENVTVEFYRNLPTYGYQIIILRVHAALGPKMSRPLAFFASENYSDSKYVYEQLADQLARVTYDAQNPNTPTYFGIWPEFVRSSMNGRFQNTTIFAMGCDGLYYTDMAAAFIEKGARVFVGWFGPVSASHTDATTAHLLQHFLIEKSKLKQSVQETFEEVGFDPIYKSLLIYYPTEAGEQTIGNIDNKN